MEEQGYTVIERAISDDFADQVPRGDAAGAAAAHQLFR